VCGIAGILRRDDRPLPSPEVVRRMRDAIRHRGPNEIGEHIGERVHLAAARLSIIDPQGGHQPAVGCDPGIVVVYNGEIYNHRALREDLIGRGHVIADRCDTTLLPHLYEEYGARMVERLRGMFAFALWDERRRLLVLARDRLGIKPLYYAEAGGLLLFGSEIKSIFASGLVGPRIDRDALDDLFSLTYPLAPRTMFERVLELRPAHTLIVGEEQKMERYWRIPFPAAGGHHQGSRRSLERELADRLRAVVRDHLVADVAVGAYLSGGIDSNAILSLIRDAKERAPTTLSVSVGDPRFDEIELARSAARSVGSNHHTVDLGREHIERYPEVMWHLELPLHVPGAIGALLLAERAREEKIPVILTGDGADELFGGYDCFKADKMRRMLSRPVLRALIPLVYRHLYRWIGMPEGAVEWMREAQSRPDAEITRAFGGARPAWYETWQVFVDRQRLLGLEGRVVRPSTEAPRDFADLMRDDLSELHPLDAALAIEAETRLPSWILVISDRAAMARGIEARVPFLDHELAEWIARLPPSMKMRGFTEKAALRGSMRGLVPREVLHRPKRPFAIPIGDWFFQPGAPEYVGALLDPRAVRESGIFDPDIVADLRTRLVNAPMSMTRVRLELTLMLILGVQILDGLFVRGAFSPVFPARAMQPNGPAQQRR
jgi:asparagine synthase (glutamine-hydrolysing)